jgi:hypothetical protein
MLAAVQLENRATWQTNEVDDVISKRELAAKLEIREATVAKLFPDECFMFGLASPKVAGTVLVTQRHDVHPHP